MLMLEIEKRIHPTEVTIAQCELSVVVYLLTNAQTVISKG